MELTVHSPKKYQLAHLLEKGHAKRGGGRTKAVPHIAPAEESAVKQLESDIKKAIGAFAWMSFFTDRPAFLTATFISEVTRSLYSISPFMTSDAKLSICTFAMLSPHFPASEFQAFILIIHVVNKCNIIEEMGIPFAYDHFAEGESPDPPFLCYLLPGSDNFAADGRVYYKVSEVRIELYTDFKDMTLEEKVTAVLDNHGIFYEQSEVWIEEEKLYEVAFEFAMPV